MQQLGEVAVVVVLLVASVVALLLLWVARRESTMQREQATRDVAGIHANARVALAEVDRREARLTEREDAFSIERAVGADLVQALRDRDVALARAERELADRVGAATAAALSGLEKVAGLTASQARTELERTIVGQAGRDAEAAVRRAESTARRTADERARRIVATAVQRIAAATSSQAVVVVVPLPSEEMKGRIIGKEGRNIRTFEALTGVNVLIDDTPDSVMLSCFDAERREVAQVALEALIADGRIHPQRIESSYAVALAGAEERAVAAGQDAADDAGVRSLHPELVRTMGRLRLRTSYGQNVLAHLVESAQIAAVMAAEIGADVELARRAAFLHDVGKALTVQVPGTHAHLGAELARRCGEAPLVVNAIAAHHDEVPSESVEAVLVQAADACSAARPGARREELDQYVERMDRIEHLVAEHPGVRRVLAMAAGREVRVIVEPETVDDVQLPGLATAIAKHIEADLSYPGEIKVTVIREIRASATAG
jgi:ribonuclease Y